MDKINLDKYQKKVIKNKSKNLLVVAAAGSGKTLTIVYKIKKLIKKGVKPEEILCVTFTKAAAHSLHVKLQKENINLKVNTFHSLGYQIIRNTNYKTIVKDNILDDIIMNHLNKYSNLNYLINAPFIEYGKGNSKIIKNTILKNTIYIKYFKNTIKTFINLFKSNNYNLDSFKTFFQINKNTNYIIKQKRHKAFLKLVKQIYIYYEDYLNRTNQIDFHDMINKATDIINKEGIYPYKYIIIDEYQDTSLNKCLLIKAIQNQTNANLMAVGDDWQSIYRFTGSNLKIFTNFKKYFPKAKILKLKNTYRNSQELIHLTHKFIMKNPYQINKKVSSNKSIKKPVHIYYYQKNIQEIWNQILTNFKEETYILGRNNQDEQSIPLLSKNMKFMTVHKSKGLEAKKIIIINLENSVTSFPSKIENSEYLNYVLTKEDDMYDEERRLFYVALTRTKSTVTLLVKKNNPSIFITELLKDSSKYIKIIN